MPVSLREVWNQNYGARSLVVKHRAVAAATRVRSPSGTPYLKRSPTINISFKLLVKLRMSWFSLLPNPAQLAPLPLRLILGIVYLVHGWPKIQKPFGMSDWLRSMRFPVPGLLSVIVAIVEFFGGIFLLLGFWTQLAAGLLFINMVVATFVKIGPLQKGFVDGYEFDLTLLAALAALVLLGGGVYSLDWLLL